MSDELRQLEIELAKVKLEKEKLELQEAQKRYQKKQAVSAGVEKVMEEVVDVAKNSADTISRNVPETQIPLDKVAIFYGISIVFFLLYASDLPANKHSIWVIAFFVAVGFAGYATVLFIIKFFQTVFRKN
ncbi:hypothetical protein [Undibacterium sp. RuRC25W]|uniref:hypothetical protein n=1 Tax=Undibacterium sp. RuRC25W TaxID=3413047 RepID=UPI003BF0EDF6